jgi:hypothetical protein
MEPGLYNPKVYRRVDWDRELTLKSESGSAINLSGYTFSSSVFNKERTKKYCDMTVTVTNSSGGQIKMSMTEAQTTALPEKCFYDLRSVIGTNSDYWIKGQITVEEGYTE